MSVKPALEQLHFPGESVGYRAARTALLTEEMALRRQIESVAAHRRALPPGGQLKQDYRFVGADGPLNFSSLFAQGKDTLAIYSFMYGPDRERPCPGCTHFLDAIDGQVQHIDPRVNFVVVAKRPLSDILAFARERGWTGLHLLSTDGNTYDSDYFGDSSALSPQMRKQQDFTDGKEWDMPMFNIFRRDGKVICHTWGSEMLYVPSEPGQDYRHNDLLDPMWNLFDLTPEGRGDFQPKLNYT